MGTIGRRIDTAIRHLSVKDYENALIQLCIALDATAKKKWKSKKPGERIKLFVSEYETFIYQFATHGKLILHSGGKIVIGSELPVVIYKSIRCVLHHGDELTNYVIIPEQNNLIGIEHGKFILNPGFIDGILFAIIVDEKNRHEKCNPSLIFHFNGKDICINDCWGNLRRVEEFTGYKKCF